MTIPTLDALTAWLTSLEAVLPLPLFVLIGSVLEELISPIPATLVLGVAGSFVALKELGILYLLILTAIGTAGKTAAAWVTYWLGRTLGEFVIERWGKYFGVKVGDVHDANLKLKKSTWWIMFALRALPIAPSAAVSIASGIVRTRQRIFVTATFAGYVIRNVLIAFAGYAGIDVFENWKSYADDPVIGITIAAILTVIATYFFIKGYKKYYTKS